MSLTSALIIGVIAGVLVVLRRALFDKVKLDDPVGALAVHGMGGVFGTLAVGLFAQDKIAPGTTGNGLFFGGGFTLLFKQLIGVAAVGAFVFALSLVAWLAIKATLGRARDRGRGDRGSRHRRARQQGLPRLRPTDTTF